jgi:DNA-binding NarL/FixJ family response regulator
LGPRSNIEIVKEVSAHQDIVTAINGVDVDILLTDLNPDKPAEILCLSKFKILRPEVKIIVFTSSCDKGLIMQALGLGIQGYKFKRARTEDIVDTIQNVYRGKTCLAPNVTAVLLDHMRRERQHQTSDLTEREQEVLNFIAEGKSNSEISSKLHITVRTVKFHASSIFAKLNVRNRTEAALKVA